VFEGIHFDDDVDFLVCDYYLLVYIVWRLLWCLFLQLKCLRVSFALH